MTPLYSGVPNVLENQPLGGVWVETFALGAPAPSGVAPVTVPIPLTCPNFTTMTFQNTRNNLPSLRTMMGATSSGVRKLSSGHLWRHFDIGNLMPNFKFWSPSFPGVTVTSEVADGQYYDGSAVVQLLARGVKKIVAFLNVETILDDPNAECIVPADVAQLFGSSNNCSTSAGAKDRIKVFNKSEFPEVLGKLRASKARGGPTFARAKLDVLPNYTYGVDGGYVVDILLLVLQPSTQFLNTLAPEILKEINGGSLNNFPNYKTVFQNNAGMELTRRQVNLLASYTEWCMSHYDVQTELADLYGVPKNRVTCTDDFQCKPALVGAYVSDTDCAQECKSGYICQTVNGAPSCFATRAGSLTKAACDATCK
jgi:hypothetical protein